MLMKYAVDTLVESYQRLASFEGNNFYEYEMGFFGELCTLHA